MFKPFYCCFGLFFRRTSFCSSRSVHPALQAVLCSPCIANVLNFLIQRRPTRTLFYSNFQGFTYCSIFDFQGSLLLSVSAATRLVYQMLFCLSTTFFIYFQISFWSDWFCTVSRCSRWQLVYNIIPDLNCQQFFWYFNKFI